MEYENILIETLEEVYEPREDSFLAAAQIKKMISKMNSDKISILDMGTGSGILGLVAASDKKVAKATFADLNPSALRLAKSNYMKNRDRIFAKCDFVKSDLFSKVRSRYDLVIFNTPYLPNDSGPGKKMISKAWEGGKEGVETTIRFLEGLNAHLKSGGKALIVVSSFGNLGRLRAKIKKKGLISRVAAKTHIFFEDIVVLEISVA